MKNTQGYGFALDFFSSTKRIFGFILILSAFHIIISSVLELLHNTRPNTISLITRIPCYGIFFISLVAKMIESAISMKKIKITIIGKIKTTLLHLISALAIILVILSTYHSAIILKIIPPNSLCLVDQSISKDKIDSPYKLGRFIKMQNPATFKLMDRCDKVPNIFGAPITIFNTIYGILIYLISRYSSRIRKFN